MGVYQPNSSSNKIYEKIDAFTGGINIVDENNKLQDGEHRNLENITLIEEGSIKKRTGYIPVLDFKDASYFKYIFNKDLEFEKTKTVDIDLTNINNSDFVNNALEPLNEIIEFLNAYRLIKYSNIVLKLNVYTDTKDDGVRYNVLSPTYFTYYNNSDRIFKRDLNPNQFDIHNLNGGNYLGFKELDSKYFIIPVISGSFIVNSFNPTENINTAKIYTDNNGHTLTLIFGDSADSSTINTQIFQTNLGNYTDIKGLSFTVEVEFPIKPTDAQLSSFEVIDYEEVYNNAELTGYLIAYKYNNNNKDQLWFIYYEISTEKYLFIEWNIINDIDVDSLESNDPKDPVYQYRLKQNEDKLAYTIAEIEKNNFYFLNANSLDNVYYKAVSLTTYNDKIYATTGFGILEITYNDIISGQIYEMIPHKPSIIEYQDNYSNLLANQLRKDLLPITNQSELVYDFQNIWNWDWMVWNKGIKTISGIFTKYPVNSTYPTNLRSSINYTDPEMVSQWQYQWRWVAPQGLQTSDNNTDLNKTLPILSDFSTKNWEFTWKNLNQPETINNYVITNPNQDATILPFTEISSSLLNTKFGDIQKIPNFYLGGDPQAQNGNDSSTSGGATQFPIKTILDKLSGSSDKFDSLDFNGALTCIPTINSAGADIVKLGYLDLTNWRIEVWQDTNTKMPGDATAGEDYVTKGWWKLNTPSMSWNTGSSTYSNKHTFNSKNASFGIINNKDFLTAIQKIQDKKSAFIKIICSLEIYHVDYGAFNGHTTLKFIPTAYKDNPIGLNLSLKYEAIDISDSNSLGLVPVSNIEDKLNLELLPYIKQCTNAISIRDQMFYWGAESAPNMIWYSQPYNPRYVPVINTISLNRLSKEVIKTIVPFGQNYLIFTDKTIWIMQFRENGIYIEIGNPNYGVEFADSVTGVGNSIFFLGYDGIYKISSSGMDINNTIKIRKIDRKITGLVNFDNINFSKSVSFGENYWLLVGNTNNKNSFKILDYYSLRDVWVQHTTQNNFHFNQMHTLKGRVYSLTNAGILYKWFTPIDEKEITSKIDIKDSNNKVIKYGANSIYSDGSIDYPIRCTILTKELSAQGELVHNKKKFKELHIKQTKNYFNTTSFLTWYKDGLKSINPYEYNQDINNAIIGNLNLKQGTFLDKSLFIDGGSPLGDNTEYNTRFKKGEKSYTSQIKIENKEALPFGLKSLLLVYKIKKAK